VPSGESNVDENTVIRCTALASHYHSPELSILQRNDIVTKQWEAMADHTLLKAAI
jgi:hypothetical protein